jgi:Uma2 family endonuclease
VVKEFGTLMTRRNRHHGKLTARVAQLLGNWLDTQPQPRGEIYDGEVGCRLQQNPDLTVGIDVAYASAEVAANSPDDSELIDGVPILVVEVLSPYDTQEQIHEKIDTYLEAGVALVWVIDPYDRTVRVYRPGAEVELFNVTQELSGEPHLPGFRVRVAAIFSR